MSGARVNESIFPGSSAAAFRRRLYSELAEEIEAEAIALPVTAENETRRTVLLELRDEYRKRAAG